jgi:PAS domain S-box-containing protein
MVWTISAQIGVVWTQHGEDFMTSAYEPRDLRGRAERSLARRSSPESTGFPKSAPELVHELQVHQIELQMQNDALRDVQFDLEAAREKYRMLYDLSPVACVSIGADARITEANRACAALLEVSPESLLRQKLSRFVAAEQIEIFERFRRELLASDQRQSCTLELVAASARRREVRLEGVQAQSPAGRQYLIALIDQTELHQLQRRSRQAHKLETLGTLSSGVAHSFNNLLSATLSCVEAALMRLGPEDAARGPIEQLQGVALHGRSIVDQILRFARPAARIEPEPIALDAAVEAAARLLRRLLGTDVNLELDLRAGDACVRIDRGELDQILFNLATNARHAMPTGGKLRIESRLLEANSLHVAVSNERTAPARVLLAVSDTGLGMDAETRKRAMQPFFSTKRPSSGTGLGLSTICDSMAQAGGHVELQSAPGRGTTVFLYWPLSEPAPHATHEMSLPPDRSLQLASAPRVLLVDDDRLVRIAIRRYLQYAGCQVVEAGSREAALELLQEAEQNFELLVADVVLPGGFGTDLARKAKQVKPELATVFVSGHTRGELVQRGWVEDDAIVLHKPFSATELQAAVQQALTSASAAASTSAAQESAKTHDG